MKAAPARSPKVMVMDVYLKPLAGAKVLARQYYGLKSSETPVGVTDAAGALAMPAAYKGAIYTFRAALPGYYGGGAKCPPVGSDNWIDSVEISMEPATNTIKGKVVDAAGKPIAGATVTTDFGLSSVTDEMGEFALEQMPGCMVRLDARKGKASGTNLDAKGRLINKPETVIVLR